MSYVLILFIAGERQYVGPFSSYASAKAYGLKLKEDKTEGITFIEVANLYPVD